jgi:hypothetical protein
MADKPPNAPGGFSGLVGQVLSFIDKPWKAVVVVVLIFILGIGYLIWDQREALIKHYTQTQEKTVLKADLSREMRIILQGTRSDIVTVWSLDIGANQVNFVAGMNRGDGAWSPSDIDVPNELPAIIDGTDSKAVVRMLKGLNICIYTEKGWGILLRRASLAGYKRICIIPITPYRVAPIAAIALIWKEAVPDEEERAAVSLADNEGDDMLLTPGRHR